MKKVFTLLTFLIIATAMVFAGERSEQQMRDAAKDTAGQTRVFTSLKYMSQSVGTFSPLSTRIYHSYYIRECKFVF